MRFRSTVIAIMAFSCAFSQGQTNTSNHFEDFARKQDILFVSLYEKRDVRNYSLQLKKWIKEYDKLSGRDKKTYGKYLARAYYNLSCSYALLGNSTMALDQLEKAIEAGFTDYSHIRQDGDLKIVRSEPRFDSLLLPLRALGDYNYILKKGGAYNTADNRELPSFTYQSAESPELITLRQSYKLDSIAGGGNDISKVLNMLHWVHELIPHDGNHENPATKNSLQLIAICRKEQRGLNCRGLATVLNECYLSLGFASRLVTCLPKDSLGTDPDCHVINVVYLPSLEKWIWTDPTNDAYIMNEKGELLDVLEVRERIIRNEPLILNPTANWNHRSSTVKQEYLYRYMAKNLYILQCPVNSIYDLETPVAGKKIQYIQLLPLDYFNQGPSVRTMNKKDMIFEFYNTNNPSLFWKKP